MTIEPKNNNSSQISKTYGSEVLPKIIIKTKNKTKVIPKIRNPSSQTKKKTLENQPHHLKLHMQTNHRLATKQKNLKTEFTYFLRKNIYLPMKFRQTKRKERKIKQTQVKKKRHEI